MQHAAIRSFLCIDPRNVSRTVPPVFSAQGSMGHGVAQLCAQAGYVRTILGPPRAAPYPTAASRGVLLSTALGDQAR